MDLRDSWNLPDEEFKLVALRNARNDRKEESSRDEQDGLKVDGASTTQTSAFHS